MPDEQQRCGHDITPEWVADRVESAKAQSRKVVRLAKRDGTPRLIRESAALSGIVGDIVEALEDLTT